MKPEYRDAISLTQKIFSRFRLQKPHGNSFKINSFRDMFSIISSISSAGGLNPTYKPEQGNIDFGRPDNITIITARGQSFKLNKENLYVELAGEFANTPVPESYSRLQDKINNREISLNKAIECFCDSRSSGFLDAYNMMYSCAFWFSESIRHRCFFALLLSCLSTRTVRTVNPNTKRDWKGSDIIEGGIAWDRKGYGMIALGDITNKHPIDLLSNHLQKYYQNNFDKAYNNIQKKLQILFQGRYLSY